MTREDLDHLVDVTRPVPDELEIVREPAGDEPFMIVDAREGGENLSDDDATEVHAAPISPEMIGLPAPSSDLLPRRRRFLLRTRPAVTEPHAEPRPESQPEPDRASHAGAVPLHEVRGEADVVDDPASPVTDRPDLAGFRLPGTRAPRPPRAAAPRVVEPAAPPRVVESATGTPARPDRRARRRSRQTRVLVASCAAFALLALLIVVLLLALVAD